MRPLVRCGVLAVTTLSAAGLLLAPSAAAGPPGGGSSGSGTPPVSVHRMDDIDIGDPNPECRTDLADGRFLLVAAQGIDDLLTVSVVDPPAYAAGDAFVAFEGKALEATVALTTPEGEPAGEALVALRMAGVTGSESWRLRQQFRVQRFTRQELVIDGTVRLPDGTTVPIDCVGVRTVVKEVTWAPHGPGPGGPAPVNDAREGAVLLAPGEHAVTRTRGAEPEPEADLWCYSNVPDDPGFYPGYSVWYRFTGTGGPLTVDTAGSSFNTTLAVYRVRKGTAREVACADDDGPPVRTYQAYRTVDTVEGAQYLVQVGGLGGEYGLLKIALR